MMIDEIFCEFYITHAVHILTFTVSTKECIQYNTIHDKYQTLTYFGTGVPSRGVYRNYVVLLDSLRMALRCRNL
jgi:hypothetical protein